MDIHDSHGSGSLNSMLRIHGFPAHLRTRRSSRLLESLEGELTALPGSFADQPAHDVLTGASQDPDLGVAAARMNRHDSSCTQGLHHELLTDLLLVDDRGLEAEQRQQLDQSRREQVQDDRPPDLSRASAVSGDYLR